MTTQMFGVVELSKGKARAMLCLDADKPQEFIVNLWDLPNTAPFAVLLELTAQNHQALELKGLRLYRTSENGALNLPTALTAEEAAELDALRVKLTPQGGGFVGAWFGRGDSKGRVEFDEPPVGQKVVATLCRDWSEFKEWASSARREHDATIFRGHGSSKFPLQTTLARAGRNRLHRYCMDTLAEFHGQAEAVLGLRLDISDPNEYSVVLGLAQHHGLPTPLLDWTESPYIAAFFAFSDALEQKANRIGDTHVRIHALTRAFVEETSPLNVVMQVAYPFVATLAISPRHNPRLLVQQGKFLVTNIADLDQWFSYVQTQSKKSFLHAVDVPIEFAIEALEDLAFMGLTAASLFPGLDGVCKKIRHQMSLANGRIKPSGLPSEENSASSG